ncbi:MAG: translocation and assembly module TamB [Blastocatellia bacterium]|jgi:translocation and assembly module TamB|nr:translocation and assembly module TamB [Blastocatellia bacterium]
MPVDNNDDAPAELPRENKKSVSEALQSETDEPLPPAAEAIAERDAARKHPVTPQGRRRRYLTKRNAVIAGIAIAVGAVALVLILFTAYKLGFVDNYVAGQIKDTLAKYGIRAEIKEFHTSISPKTVEMLGIELYDAKTGEKLGKIDRILATVRIEDLYAINLRRNINLQDLKIEGLELWVLFDDQGRSNFRNIKIPPPEPNQRILFAYSTAHVELKNGVVHYGDVRHELSGEARNLRAIIDPDDPNAPAASAMNRIQLSSSNSTFVYDGKPVNNIDIEARIRANNVRAEIQELVLRSPIAEAHLQGTLDDWRAMRYQMDVTSTVDLTQTSDIFQTGATLRGAGNFVGKVTGEGDRYQAEGTFKSDALAADNLRLKGLSVTAKGSGQGKSYQANGRAVAELLSLGDFQLNSVQIAGNVMGTGKDFSWVGELRAAAEKSYGTTITGLILRDARAELRDGVLTASSGQANANSVAGSGASAGGVQVNDIRVRSENGVTTATIASAKTGPVKGRDVNVSSISANKIDAVDKGGATTVNINTLQLGSINAMGAQTGSISIAGVRLAIHNGRVQGSTGDINAGTVTFKDGQAESVRLARPVFTVEPSGRYRASADLSIGGGVLADMKLGAVRAAVVATSNQIQLNNFTAEALSGRASGNATISTAKNGASRVNADFADLDVAGLLAVLSKRVVPLSGKASGKIDLTFKGSDFRTASGNINTHIQGEAGDATSGRTPISGDLAMTAAQGLFQIQQANLQTGSTTLKASGQFGIERDSNLQVELASADASELQRLFISSGLFPDIEDQLNSYGLELGGKLAFNGTLQGQLKDPIINGRAELGSLIVNGQDIGSLSASLASTPTELRITDGRLIERDGGGVQFTLDAPRGPGNNTSLVATLDKANAANLLAALPLKKDTRAQLGDTQSDVSGTIKISGLPDAMSGSAELRFGPGRLAGNPLESMIARANFSGTTVNVESVDATLAAGHIAGSGTFDTKTTQFELRAKGERVQLERLLALTNQAGAPRLKGTADITAQASGIFSDFTTYDINFSGEGHDVTINGRSAGTLSLVGRTQNKKLDVTFTTGVLGAPQVVTAQVDLSNELLPATIDTTLTGVDLTPLFKIILPEADVAVTGRATGTLHASGNLMSENEAGEQFLSLAALRGKATFTDLSVNVKDTQLTAVSPLIVSFTPNEVAFEKTQFTGPGTNITLGGTIATGVGGRENFTADGKVNLRIFNGISPDVFSSGTADLSVRVAGSYENPRVSGLAALSGASVSILSGDDRMTIANVVGRVRFNANQAQIESMKGTLGGGTLTASGGALLDGFALAKFSISVHGNDVSLPFPPDFHTTTDGDLEIKGTARDPWITGTLNLRRVEYTKDIELADLINSRHETTLSESGTESLLSAAHIDIRAEGRNALFVRNNIADLTASVSLRASGEWEDPIISGRITATSGTLTFRNDRYELSRGLMELPFRPNADPIVNIQAESEIRGYRVIVNLSGPLSQPLAVVRSEPSLPQADVVSLITTGNLSTGDTGGSILSQSGLGTAASLLTDTLINAPASRATSKLFGLSRFEINPQFTGRSGSTPTARLTLGRRISKELSVTYSTNVASDPNQILALEYRLSNRMSFIAQYEQGSLRNLSSRNDNFSFEIRFRKRF